MAVTLNKANLVLKDANGNIGKIEQLSDRDLAKIRTAVSDVALVVNQSNHTPIEATTTNKGVVQLATPADVVSGASDKVVTAEQLHNATTGTSALATENLARIDAVVTEAGIPIDHTNTNQLKTAVTTLINNAVPSTATSTTLGVVKPDNDTITIDSNGVLTATAQMPGVATNATVGVVKPDGSTITVDGDGTLTATAQMPGVATNTTVGVVKPDNDTIKIDSNGTISAPKLEDPIAGDGIEIDTTSGIEIAAKVDGSSVVIDSNGSLSVPVATVSEKGIVQTDETTVFNKDGVLSADVLDIANADTTPDANRAVAYPASELLTPPSGASLIVPSLVPLAALPEFYRRKTLMSSNKTSITIYEMTMVNIGTKGYILQSDVTLDLTSASSWDDVTSVNYTMASKRAGRDFYVYACKPVRGIEPVLILSANSTVPDGYDQDTSRKIGGFHCLCSAVGTLNWRNPATLKNETHWLSGYLAGDILPASIWDLSHRATSENEGMVYSSETGMWFDIYLSSWDGNKLVSVLGGTTADGASSKKFHGEMFVECAAQVKKELISRDDFIVVAKGSNECTVIHGTTDAGTTGGHVDTANRRMISNIGLEDCCGFLWQWCKQSGGANGSSGWTNSTYNSSVDGSKTYGSTYGNYYRACVGGAWDNSSYCGSRCVAVSHVSALVNARYGGRLASPERVSTGL